MLALLLSVSCRNLDRFDTHPGESYCGSLVGQETISTGFADGWEAKTSTPSTLALTLNTTELFVAGGIPAVITSNDVSFGPCGPSQPLFDRAPARTLGKSIGDRLSAMKLGEDHQEDVVLFVDSSCSGSMVAILSLIQNGDVELRLLRPAPLAASDPAATVESTERFGLFVLTKAKEGCGF
jgi:hypothetical protein